MENGEYQRSYNSKVFILKFIARKKREPRTKKQQSTSQFGLKNFKIKKKKACLIYIKKCVTPGTDGRLFHYICASSRSQRRWMDSIKETTNSLMCCLKFSSTRAGCRVANFLTELGQRFSGERDAYNFSNLELSFRFGNL